MNITDKIKSFEDACQLLGIETKLPEVSMLPENHQKAIVAHYKLIIITEALNEGWIPNWNNWDEPKHYAWFYMGDFYEVGLKYYDFMSWDTSSGFGSRLCYKTGDLANYAAATFIQLYSDFFTR